MESAGQNSQLYNFKVNLTGSCPEETSGMIHGTLWEDQCYPWGGPIRSLGMCMNEYDMLFTNQTYDPGEPGIEGAVVTISTGPCPLGTILRAVPTWGDGTYDFYWVPPGTYCLSIDLYYAWNAFLMPGTWTFPLDAVMDTVAEQTISLDLGDTLNVDWGWWFTYGNGWGETRGSVVGMVWHDSVSTIPATRNLTRCRSVARMTNGASSTLMESGWRMNREFRAWWWTSAWVIALQVGTPPR